MNAARNEKLDEVPLRGIDPCRTEVNRFNIPTTVILLGKMRVGSCENHGTPGVRRTVRARPNSVLQSRVAKPVRRYLAHTRADKAALLCGPAFCARIPRVFAPLYPPRPPRPLPVPRFPAAAQWNRAFTMQFCPCSMPLP